MRNRWATVGLLLAICFTALSMRMPIIAAGVLTGRLREALHISGAAAGLFTTVTVLVFAATSPLMGRLGNRFGINRVLAIGLALTLLGQWLRASGTYPAFLAGTVLLASGISSANVLLPPFIRIVFPRRVGLLTSLYIALMNGSSAIAAGLVLPLAAMPELGWQGALLAFLPFTVIALAIWLPYLRRGIGQEAAEHRERRSRGHLPLRHPLVWQITFFMGLQSFLYYSLVTWLPTVLLARGIDVERTGLVIFTFQMWNIPFAFLMPMLAARFRSQWVFGLISGCGYIVGIPLMWLGHDHWLDLAAFCLGISSGATFSLAVLFFNLRTPNANASATLSGMSQGIGYTLAAIGPFLVGFLEDQTGQWQYAIILLTAMAGVVALCGALSGRNLVLPDPDEPHIP